MVRGLRYHVREWGEADAPPIILVHGWMDVSASFQFVADYLAANYRVLAPDWRGYGLSDWPATDSYLFADYLADLDILLDSLVGDQAIPIIGHSMGGNVVMLYGGVRPQRATHVINLEGFGMPATKAEQAPRRFARWIDELKQPMQLRPYANVQEVAARLMKNNPRLTQERADFLAPHWAGEVTLPDGSVQWQVRGDPAHRRINPILYRVEEVLACWRAITAQVLWVEALQTENRALLGGIPDFEERLTQVPKLSIRKIDQAGHMLHHDQPEQVATLIREFLLT
jgi:pimeloyl-ACP methyl ester carboxylesterase